MIKLTITENTPVTRIVQNSSPYIVGLMYTRIWDTINPTKCIELVERSIDYIDFPAKIYIPLLDIKEHKEKNRKTYWNLQDLSRKNICYVEEICIPNYIIQHIPNFMDGFKSQSGTFNTTEELLNIDWVKKYSKYNDFYRYSINSDKLTDVTSRLIGKQHVLMVERNEGKKWWVVGYLQNIENVNLPTWRPVYV